MKASKYTQAQMAQVYSDMFVSNMTYQQTADSNRLTLSQVKYLVGRCADEIKEAYKKSYDVYINNLFEENENEGT